MTFPVTAVQFSPALVSLTDGWSRVGANSSPPAAGFSKLLGPIAEADHDLKVAEAAMEGVARGEPREIHEVMIDLERARLSVLTLIQVRNKALEAYQELMRMQV